MPSSGRDDVQDHPNRRRLPGAVGSEQPIHRAARDVKREVADRDMSGVALYDAIDVDRERHELGLGDGRRERKRARRREMEARARMA